MIIKDIEALRQQIEKHKQSGKKIVRTNGCFDLMHPGHIETFRAAQELGDILIVGMNGDASLYFATKPWRPINKVLATYNS